MNPLAEILALSRADREQRGLLYTPAEIARQPAVWPGTLAIIEQRIDEIRAFLEGCGLRGELGSRPAVTLIGAGTSDYVGQCLVSLFRDKWQCEAEATPSTTLLTNFADALEPPRRRLWISFSRSGNSPEGVAVLQRARVEQPEIAHIVISCDGNGKMAQMIQGQDNCLSIVLGEEANDEGLAMTGSFTNMVVCGHALAHAWDLEEYRTILQAMCSAAEPFLDRAARMAATAAARGFQRGCFLGSGALAGLAAESALKVLELSAGCVKTMSETPLGLRHGPMAALDADTLLVLFVSNDETRRNYEIDLLREIAAKGIVGMIVAVNGAGYAELTDLPETQLLAPDGTASVPDPYRPAIDVLFGQCLGLFFSLHFGFAPDTPSPNGIISRVVPAFALH
jgi:tagatose-6-phosphate ketose/aldose isomerase